MKTIFRKLNFGILSMRARVRVIITGKLLWRQFFRNKILESEQNFRNYLSLKISRYTVHWLTDATVGK